MNQTKTSAALDQAQIVLRQRGYTSFERRTENTEFSGPITYMVATNAAGAKAEAYPRVVRGGMSYKIYED